MLFICERGKVKSLMAASFFNRLAMSAGLEFKEVSPGMLPDSTTVSSAILAELQADGIDADSFVPQKLASDDVSGSVIVIAIGVGIPHHPMSIAESTQSCDDIASSKRRLRCVPCIDQGTCPPVVGIAAKKSAAP